MSSKSKRRVTVDTGNAVSEDSEKRKPSVFERLGPGGGQRKYSEYEAGSAGDRGEKKCRPYLLTGECPYGSTCKYKHVQLSSRKSKSSREGEGSPENLRLKLKGQQSERSSEKRRDSDSESADRTTSRSRRDKDPESRDKSGGHDRSRRDKETKIRSQVVVKKSSGNQGSDDSDASNEDWFESLDYKKEPELEQKLQQLQRELSQLDEEGVETGPAQKKQVAPAHSGSDSSPDLGRSGSGRRPSPHEKRSVSPGGYEAEEDGGHKKHKKNKKEKHRSVTPPPEPPRSKKKDTESETPRVQSSSSGHDKGISTPPSRSKRSRSSSSNGSVSPPRSKDSKDKGQIKAKAKKKKARGGKDVIGSTSDESPAKSKKWLSPLMKTLKLKKAKSSSSTTEIKEMVEDDEAAKRRSPTPQPSQRSHSQEFLAEDPMPPSRLHDSGNRDRGRSLEKKKGKGKRSVSPRAQSSDKGGSSKRGDTKRGSSFDRSKKWSEPAEKEGRKGLGDDRRKRPATPPRQSELYSPSQLDRESPYREQSASRSRQGVASDAGRGERDFTRDDSRRGERDSRRGDKFEARPQTPPSEHQSADRYGRRGDGDSFDQYGQDRGRFDSDRNRGDFREGRGQEGDTDRDQRGRRIDRFGREGMARSRSKTDTVGRDSSFDRQETARAAGSRDQSRDGREGRDGGGERNRSLASNRGDSRELRDSGRGNLTEGKYGIGGFGGDSQRRGGQWDQSGRSSEWVGDRGEPPRDIGRDGGRMDDRGRDVRGVGTGGGGTGGGGRMYRDDSRDSLRGGDRRGRDMPPEGRQPPMDARADSRLDRGDNRLERGDSRGEGRVDRGIDRGEGRIDRGDRSLDRSGEGRMERRDRSLDRSDSRLDRGENRLDRGDNRMERGDNRMDRRRGEPHTPPFEQRGFRGRQSGVPGASEGRGGMRGMGDRSPGDGRGFEFNRRGGREGQMVRYNEPQSDFRQMRDERGFRDEFPEGNLLRDRRGDQMDRFDVLDGRDARDARPRGRGFDEPRDDRSVGRGPGDDRISRDRMPRRGGMYEFDQRPASANSDNRNASDMSPVDSRQSQQRRGPLLPTPAEEAQRRGAYDSERGGRDATRDGRDDRGRRDQRDAEFGLDSDRASLSGRGGGRDSSRDGRDAVWDRNSVRERDMGKDARDAGRDLSRDASRDTLQGGRQSERRGRISPSDVTAESDRGRDRSREDSRRDSPARREGSKTRDSVSGQDLDSSKRHADKDDDRERDRKDGPRDKVEVSDARSTRSADDVRETASPRGRRSAAEMGGKAASLRDMRDSQSDGKRSPGRSRGKDRSPLALTRSSSADRRQPKKARSLSPKQRKLTPQPTSSSSREMADKLRSPSAKSRSPTGKHGVMDSDTAPSRTGRRARSRSPGGAKRKLEDRSRSPATTKPKDDTKSPVPKRQRDESRSPGRRSSRHPSPAGSQHSRSSHTSERRRRLASSHRDGDGRFSSQNRDSPARRDRDRDRDTSGRHEQKTAAESERDEADRSDSRKRGRSPPWSRGADGGDRKRWRASDGKSGDIPEPWGDAGDELGKQGASKSAPRGAGGPTDFGDDLDPSRLDFAKVSPAAAASAALPADKGGRRPRSDSVGSRGSHRGNEDGRAAHEGWAERRDEVGSRAVSGAGADAENQAELSGNLDGGDDSKDAGLGNMLDDDEYEEISSDEGDFDTEEDKQGQNIVSILDIDWASLAKEPAPKQTTGSLLRRFHPASIFHEIGISRALAGDALFDKVKAICDEGVKTNAQKGKDVEEKSDDKENAEKPKESSSASAKMATSLHHDVPILHMSSVRQTRDRANLLRNLGPFRRALCARRDLEIRRQLCKVDKVSF
ncbi:hypothetical protein BaRGS_00023868 [Batillaria attramentaria]|uniref:C3H1-type domain-containing protein n=1 Tax=Batillaria attramentaria TaxID=370345 RepID=A0ABD0KCI3_9CAEN